MLQRGKKRETYTLNNLNRLKLNSGLTKDLSWGTWLLDK